MQFNISIVSVDITTKPTAKGSYQQATVAFRNLSTNKLEEKKILSFTDEGKALYNTASAVVAGQVYTITSEKGEKYWNWTSMTQTTPEAAAASPIKVAEKAGFQPRTYETSEERAERQVLIVRQSSLSAAVATLTTGAKTVPDIEAVVHLAQRYTDFVFQKDAKTSLFKTELVVMEDDIPY